MQKATATAITAYLAFAALPASAIPAKPSSFNGEKSSYSITYFGVTAGSLELTADSIEDHASYVAKARTDSIFSLFYRLRNRYETSVDLQSGLPTKFVATLDESRQKGTQTQEFDQTKRIVRLTDQRDLALKTDIERDFIKKLPTSTQDVLSALFHLRRLPLATGKTFEFPILIGEKPSLLSAHVIEIEELPTELGRISAFVIQPSIKVNGELKEIPETFLWIANDETRALLKVKAKVKIGSVVAYLQKFSPSTLQ
jgi:hypothetical protein